MSATIGLSASHAYPQCFTPRLHTMHNHRREDHEIDHGGDDSSQVLSFLGDVFERHLDVKDGRHADASEVTSKSAFSIAL